MAALVRTWSLARTRTQLSTLGLTRRISTSKQKQETAALDTTVAKTKTEVVQPKIWMSYGFDMESEKDDRHIMHGLMFVGVTLCFVVSGTLLAYRPDDLSRDWTQREAYLELRRREKLGLPLVDPNYISLDRINLPTDEELGNTEIII